MAVMMVVMVVLLAIGGHHGFQGSHDPGPPAAETVYIQADPAKPEEDKQ